MQRRLLMLKSPLCIPPIFALLAMGSIAGAAAAANTANAGCTDSAGKQVTAATGAMITSCADALRTGACSNVHVKATIAKVCCATCKSAPSPPPTSTTRCVPGSFAQGGKCAYCTQGKYQDQNNQVSCKACPPGTVSEPSGKACRACPADTYLSSTSYDVNLALKRPTLQSTEGYGGRSACAVDGNRNPSYGSGSCMHSLNEAAPWWRVDLESPSN